MAVNFIAVLIAAVLAMVLGFLWYGPLFSKPWMKLVGMTKKDMEEQKGSMGKTYGMMFVSALLTAWILSNFVGYAGAQTWSAGAMVGFWAWLGFVATTMFSNVLFEKKPFPLFLIDAGYHLVNLLVMGAVLAMM